MLNKNRILKNYKIATFCTILSSPVKHASLYNYKSKINSNNFTITPLIYRILFVAWERGSKKVWVWDEHEFGSCNLLYWEKKATNFKIYDNFYSNNCCG